MLRVLSRISVLIGGLRWLFMPAGLFALVAVGVHVGADRLCDNLLAALDSFDGGFDRVSAAVLGAVGRALGSDAQSIDRWALAAASFVDLEQRASFARWSAVVLELVADFVLALPLLGYSEHDRSTRASPRAPRPDALSAIREAMRRPTLAVLALPAVTAAVALAGACRIAEEMRTETFGLLSGALSPELSGDLARLAAILVLGGACVSLGVRAVAQSIISAHAPQLARPPRRVRAPSFSTLWRLAAAAPIGLAAALGIELVSFFR